MNKTLKIYHSLQRFPLGNWIFSRAVCRTAPFFGSIRPYIKHLERNHCECLIKKRRSVHNHIKTVHVIAICNGLEMAMGVMAEASVPKHLRWIPKGMEVDYTAKANSDIRCVAKIDNSAWTPGDACVEVIAYDDSDTIVVKGKIKLWITEKPQQ